MATASSSIGSGLGSYIRLLHTSGAAALAFSGTVGRFPVAMRSLACLMLVTAATGSVGKAGAVSAAMLVAQGMAGPVLGRLADLRGQRMVLLSSAAVHAAGMTLLVAAIEFGAPLWTMIASAAGAGCAAVSFSSFMRARWTAFVDPSALRTAFALESMLDETIYLLGPLLATGLVSTRYPIVGLIVCALLTAAGSVAVAAHRESEPGRGRDSNRSAEIVARTRAFAVPAVRVLMVVYGGMGFLLGCVDITLISFARERTAPGLAGVFVSLTAVGSLAGGMAYGAIDWRPAQARLLAACTGVLTVGVIPLSAAPNGVVLGVLAVLAGVAISPGLIAASTLLESIAPADCLSEGFSWLNGAGALGIASGTFVGAIAAAHGGFRYADWMALAGGLLAFAASTAGQSTLRRGRTVSITQRPS